MEVGSSYLRDARIVVIGAGAVGSVLSYRLAQAGAKVTTIERRFPGAGTSGNSFAWLNSASKTPLRYHRLAVRSIREHQDLARELDGHWVHVDGGVAWANARDADRSKRLRDKVRQRLEWGYRIEKLTPERVMNELEPDLFIDPDRVEEVYYTPMEGWINGVGLCHGTQREASRRYGAKLVLDEVVEIRTQSDAIESVILRNGETLYADAVVNAAGPCAGHIAEMVGTELPITQNPGIMLVTAPVPVDLRSVVHAPEVFARADGGWRILLHGESFDSYAEAHAEIGLGHEFAQRGMELATEILPGLKRAKPEGLRYGVRPMPKDGHPIVGFDSRISGFYHAVMHSGATLSAVMGSLIAEDFAGMCPEELEPFKIDRFSDGSQLIVHATEE